MFRYFFARESGCEMTVADIFHKRVYQKNKKNSFLFFEKIHFTFANLNHQGHRKKKIIWIIHIKTKILPKLNDDFFFTGARKFVSYFLQLL